jgi:hypothetical protein
MAVNNPNGSKPRYADTLQSTLAAVLDTRTPPCAFSRHAALRVLESERGLGAIGVHTRGQIER